MWMKRLWRWMRGEVRFYAQGGLCERFLNLLSDDKDPVRLWDIVFEDGAVTASCCTADYMRIRPFARRTGTRVRHLYSRGFMKSTAPVRKRPGLFAGVALATAVYLLLASRIWVVEIYVSDESLRGAVEEELRACGIAVGEPMTTVSIPQARMDMIAAMPQIHHAAIWFEGSVAQVDITLAEDTVTLPDTTPTNVVAARDGLILSMRVSSGQKIAKVGEAVVAGDLLVCGAVETTEGILLRHAEAEILAQTWYTFEVTAKREETVMCPKERRVCPTLRLLSLTVPLYTSEASFEGWQAEPLRQSLTLFDTALPIGLDTTVYTAFDEQAITYTDEQMEALAKERMQALLDTALSGKETVEIVYDGQLAGDTYHLKARCTVVENIAKEQPLLIDAA